MTTALDDTGQPTVDRKPGWYWVRVFEGAPWHPYHWYHSRDGEAFWIGRAADDKPMAEIGNRIPRPDERPALPDLPTVDRLIAQLEAATCGSRKLDGDIAAALGENVAESAEINPQPCGSEGNYVPHYTTSLDAALTLVPEGWGIKADCGLGYGNTFTVGHVGANKLYDKPEGWGEAATPALALCIAALQARQISQRETGAPL